MKDNTEHQNKSVNGVAHHHAENQKIEKGNEAVGVDVVIGRGRIHIRNRLVRSDYLIVFRESGNAVSADGGARFDNDGVGCGVNGVNNLLLAFGGKPAFEYKRRFRQRETVLRFDACGGNSVIIVKLSEFGNAVFVRQRFFEESLFFLL